MHKTNNDYHWTESMLVSIKYRAIFPDADMFRSSESWSDNGNGGVAGWAVGWHRRQWNTIANFICYTNRFIGSAKGHASSVFNRIPAGAGACVWQTVRIHKHYHFAFTMMEEYIWIRIDFGHQYRICTKNAIKNEKGKRKRVNFFLTSCHH